MDNVITVQDVKSKTEERFWSKIKFGEPNECWEWQRRLNHAGYGHYQTYRFNKSSFLAHRYMIFKLFGIPDGLWVLHHCDNPKCVNPNHLFLGTAQDNMEDMYSKNRNVVLKGADHGMAKLSEADIIEIQRRLYIGDRGVDIAKYFGVTRAMIGHIKMKRNWKHLSLTT